jgi:hypothetical protein
MDKDKFPIDNPRRLKDSRDLLNVYKGKYPYAADIKYPAIIDCLAEVFS